MKIIGATVGTTMPRSNLNQTDPKKADYIRGKENLDTTLATILKDIEDLKYEPITVSGFKHDVENAGVLEKGREINAVTLSWVTNKTPVSMTLDGEAVEIPEGATEFSVPLELKAGEGITGDKTWIVKAVDERGAEATDTASVKFLNGVYYGSMAYGAAIDSAAILSLTKNLQSGKAINFVTPGDGKRPVYALPSGYGTPIFKIGGNEYEWEKVADAFQFENDHGHVESYDVWMHGQNVADKITVNVT